MLAIKVILGLCMTLHVLAETDKLNVIRALSNDQVINAINFMVPFTIKHDTNFRIIFNTYKQFSWDLTCCKFALYDADKKTTFMFIFHS